LHDCIGVQEKDAPEVKGIIERVVEKEIGFRLSGYGLSNGLRSLDLNKEINHKIPNLHHSKHTTGFKS